MMNTATTPQTVAPMPRTIPQVMKSNKKKLSKGGKKKEVAENAPIFLRSKYQYMIYVEPT